MNLTRGSKGTSLHGTLLIDLETDPRTSVPSTCSKTTIRILKEHGPTYKKLRGKGEVPG